MKGISRAVRAIGVFVIVSLGILVTNGLVTLPGFSTSATLGLGTILFTALFFLFHVVADALRNLLRLAVAAWSRLRRQPGAGG